MASTSSAQEWASLYRERCRLRQCKLLDKRKMDTLTYSACLEMGEHLYGHITVLTLVLSTRVRVRVDYACAIYNMGMRKQGYSADVEYEQQRKKNRDYYVP